MAVSGFTRPTAFTRLLTSLAAEGELLDNDTMSNRWLLGPGRNFRDGDRSGPAVPH